MGSVALGAVVLGLLAACAGPAPSLAGAASEACEEARTVPPIGSPGEDKYQAEPGELEAWADALERAAERAAAAASGDSAYEDLSADLDASRDDFAHIRDTLAGGGAVTGDELTAIKERVAALVEACEDV
jgi:hypothetical protein